MSTKRTELVENIGTGLFFIGVVMVGIGLGWGLFQWDTLPFIKVVAGGIMLLAVGGVLATPAEWTAVQPDTKPPAPKR